MTQPYIKNEKAVLFLLAALQFTNIMDFMIMMPLSVHIMPAFNISPQQFSFIVSAYAFAAFGSSIAASFFVDKFDRKSLLLFVYTGFLIGTFACAWAPTFYFLIFARIFAGLFGGLIAAQVLAIVGDYIPFERRGKAMGVLFAGFSLASVAGVPVGIYLADTFQWHIPFIMVGAMGVILLPTIFFLLPQLKIHLEDKNEKPHVAKIIVNDTNLQIALLMMFTLVLSHFVTIPFLAQYIEKNVGFTKAQIAWVYMVGGLSTLIFSPVIGRLADKYGKYKVFAYLVIGSWFPVFVLTNLQQVSIVWVLLVAALFFIFGAGRYVPAQALITSVVKPQYRGGFMNINASSQNLATALAALISGFIVTTDENGKLLHYNWVGFFAIAVSIICITVARKLIVKAD
ncbi:MAG: MFS transporter [Bacteroidia bacterium]|nr:MFS transporter [Bacteroidia bacterium]HQV00080.1 MFS transporter [Bacteroidia bacterium]